MLVFVRDLQGKTVNYEISPTKTILTLKRLVREKEGIPLSRIRLLYEGKPLNENNQLLQDYRISKHSTIHLSCGLVNNSYCIGCIFPLLVCLSAHISLQCGEILSVDKNKLSNSIKTKLTILNDNSMKTVFDCIETCGYEWDELENDDADYFQNHTEQRQSQAIPKFISIICDMTRSYLEKYRQSKMIENTRLSVDYRAAYDSETSVQSTLTKPINIDWFTFLHKTRCPVCFCRFTTIQASADIPDRMPMALCSISDKHVVCRDCCKTLRLCPLCQGELVANIFPAQTTIDEIETARQKLEEYCFPFDLAKEVTIKRNQQPIAHGAMGKLFRVNKQYAVKCALIANTVETEEALIHEIAMSRPLAHMPNLVTVYGGVRLPQHGIGVVMEYINGPSLAAALTDNSTVIRNLSIQDRLHIALGIAQGLGELHLANLIHRDFKPENVLLAQSSNGVYTPKIVDFGVSFQLAIASATHVNEAGGTVGYDAPETVIENKTPSAASDIYALAFTLYELLTARRVFIGLKSAQILAQFTMQHKRPQTWPNELPDFLKKVIEQSWSPNPDRRPTIGEIIHAIRKSIDRNQLPCIEMLQEANRSRRKIASVQLENFDPFDLFVLNEFVKRMLIDDCEAMEMFIQELPPSLLNK